MHPRNRQEMRQLPEEQEGEQRPPLHVDFTVRRGPAHQRRQRARDRANGCVERRDPLQRRVDEQVTRQGDRAQQTGLQVHRLRQINQPRRRADASKN